MLNSHCLFPVLLARLWFGTIDHLAGWAAGGVLADRPVVLTAKEAQVTSSGAEKGVGLRANRMT